MKNNELYNAAHYSRALSSVWLIAILLGCNSARRVDPIAPEPQLSANAFHGQQVFMRRCHQCHPQGEAGLGPAINNKPLPHFMIRTQVRNGIGAMPAFTDDEVT